MHQLQRSWVRSQHPSAQWNLRGGRWSSAEYSTKNKKNSPQKIYWCYLCWQHHYQPIELCLPRGKVYNFWRIFSPCFLHGDWYGSTHIPSPVSKGRDQWELRGGTLYTYICCYSAPLPPPPPSVIFKKEKCRKCLKHHAYSVKRCLFNLLE